MNNYIEQIRNLFPALKQQVYGYPLVYFDNAATTQKPQQVLSLLAEMEGKINGNIHRAVHYLSARCTEYYEDARDNISAFIGAKFRHEVIFTSSATAAINLVAFSFGEAFVKKGDIILLGEAEHHSNIVPWQMMCTRTGAKARYIPVDDQGRWRLDQLPSMLDKRVRLIAVSHINNVLGLVNPIKELIQIAHRHGIPVLIDGAQGIVHEKVDVLDLDCDFYLFSGHKLYGPTGTGILYGKEDWLEKMPPWQGGGDMISSVTLEGTTYADLPLKFEAGTPNYIGHSALGAAITFLNSLDKTIIEPHMHRLTKTGIDLLQNIEGLKIYGVGDGVKDKIPLFSFSIDGVHATDIATLLDKMGFAVRSGQMCAEPLLNRLGQTSLLRASLTFYNTEEELRRFVEALKKIITILR